MYLNSNMVLQKMEILPVNDLDIALQNFVNKDDKLAFYSCVQYNIQETRVSILCCIILHMPSFMMLLCSNIWSMVYSIAY